MKPKLRLPSPALLLSLAALALVAAGCGGDDDDGDEGGAPTDAAADIQTIEEGVLTVGTDAPFPPFEIGRPPDLTGYDIELMDAIAEQLGLETQYENSAFETIFRDVAAGRFDIVAAASTITPQREQTVTFSDPYYEAQQALLVEQGSDIASVDDLSGATVGAQDGTTGEAYANDETDAGTVRGFPQGPDAVNALVNGQVDAVIIDEPVAVDAVDQRGGIEIAERIQTDELYGFAMAPDSTQLIEAVNEALAQLKQDGTVEELYQKYFQTSPPESVLGDGEEGGGDQEEGAGE